MFSFVFIPISLLCFFSIASNVSADFLEDYCWRDFDDVIPSDALIAGKARDNMPIYIGQALYDNKLIPGKIHHNSSQIHIEFKTVHVLNETIKILCTKHPEKFIWIPTTTNQILNIQNKHIFEGGYEKGVLTYIGRTTSHGELTVGKVICWVNSHCIPLTTVESGKWYQYNNFEILTFDDTVATITTEIPSTTKIPTTNQPTFDVDTVPTTIPDSNTNPFDFNNTASSETPKNNSEKYKKSSYTSEKPKKASALAIFLLVAGVAVIAGLIIFLVRRC